MKAKRVVLLGLLVAMALVLHLVERLLPIPQLAPGVKLGLANIVTLFSIYTLPVSDTLLVIVVRTTLSSLFGGGLSSLMFSLTGGLASFIVMWVASRFPNLFSLPVVSVMGALAHNAGQLLVASLIVGNFAFFAYLPILVASGAITGIFIGFVTHFLLTSWSKIGWTIDGKSAPEK